MSKWQTADGRIINICDMTDAHIMNAIKYAYKREDWRSVEILTKEKQYRLDKEFFDQTCECQYCGKTMKVHTHELVDIGWGEELYSFKCGCGASSPYLTRQKITSSGEIEPMTIRKRGGEAKRFMRDTLKAQKDRELYLKDQEERLNKIRDREAEYYREHRRNRLMQDVYGGDVDDDWFLF